MERSAPQLTIKEGGPKRIAYGDFALRHRQCHVYTIQKTVAFANRQQAVAIRSQYEIKTCARA